MRLSGRGAASGRRSTSSGKPTVGGKINRADTIGLSVAAREEIASLATILEVCRSKPPYATAAASSGKRAAGLPWP